MKTRHSAEQIVGKLRQADAALDKARFVGRLERRLAHRSPPPAGPPLKKGTHKIGILTGVRLFISDKCLGLVEAPAEAARLEPWARGRDGPRGTVLSS